MLALRIIATVILAIGAILALLKNIGSFDDDVPILVCTAFEWVFIAFIIWVIWWL